MAFKANYASNIGKNSATVNSKKVIEENIVKRNVTGVINTKTNASIRSFRVDEHNWKSFDLLLERAKNLSSQNLSASRFIKSLIYVGSKLTDEEILKSIKETSV